MENRFDEMLQKLEADRAKQLVRTDKLSNDMADIEVKQAKELIDIREQSEAIMNLQCTVNVLDSIRSMNLVAEVSMALEKQAIALLKEAMKRARQSYKPRAE